MRRLVDGFARGALVLVFLGGAIAGPAVVASAHAALERSSPADGEILQSAPDRISLSFTEPPDLSLTTVGVVSSDGGSVPTGPPEAGAGEGDVVVRIDGRLADGVYTVTWRTVSRTDGHSTASAFTFGVGVEPDRIPPTRPGDDAAATPSPSILSIVGRWALYVGLVVLLGAGLGGLLAFGAAGVSRRWVLGVAWLSAAFGALAITLAERASIQVPLGTLLSSDTGGAFLRLGVAIGILGVAVLAAVLRTTRATLVLLAAGASAAMLVRAEGGHAGGSALQVALQWLHLVGAGVWIGGLVWLVLAMRRGLDPAGVRRFSNLAAGGLALLAVAGVLRASNELGFTWWLHPFRSGYSTALAIKVVAFVALFALGASNRLRNVPALERRGPRPLLRTVGGELVLAAGVFAVTAVMTGLPPTALTTPPVAPARPLVVTGSDFATTTRVRLEVSPGTVGANDFHATVTDYDTREPVAATRVSLTFGLADRPEVSSTLPLERAAAGVWKASGTNLSIAGTWTVTALIESANGSVEVPLEVTPRPPPQQIQVSRQPGQPDLYTITVQEGLQIQAYVDPGTPGRTNQVHVTAFTSSGDELPLRSATVSVTPPDGAATTPELLRFGPGHFVANIDLTAGAWRFAITAHARDGQTLVASFQQSFGS